MTSSDTNVQHQRFQMDDITIFIGVLCYQRVLLRVAQTCRIRPKARGQSWKCNRMHTLPKYAVRLISIWQWQTTAADRFLWLLWATLNGNHEFSQAKLVQVTADNIACYITQKIYRTATPTNNDRPTLGHSNTLYDINKALSFSKQAYDRGQDQAPWKPYKVSSH